MNYNNCEFVASFGLYTQIPVSEKIDIAFSGRSNVGKSSLINKLVNRKSIARVSSMPGKTITINYYKLEDINIVDLPGYGYAKVSEDERKRFSKLVDNYLLKRENLALVVQLIDFRHLQTENDKLMMDFMIENEIPFIVVLTKADKLKKKERTELYEQFKSQFANVTAIEFSAVTGEGVLEIRAIIDEIVAE